MVLLFNKALLVMCTLGLLIGSSLALQKQSLESSDKFLHFEHAPKLKIYGIYGPRKHYAWHIRHEIMLYLEHAVWPTAAEADDPDLDFIDLHYSDFRALLKNNSVEPGSLVVVSERMAELTSPYSNFFEMGNNGKKSQLDFRCYTKGSALLHYPLLQEIIAYPSPLQIFWTEDLRCKLQPSDLPPDVINHHKMYFVGSPCAAVAKATSNTKGAIAYFPIGLSNADGRVAMSEPKMQRNPLTDFLAEPVNAASQRPLLFAFRGTVSKTGAKPRREALVNAMTDHAQDIDDTIHSSNWAYLMELQDSDHPILLQKNTVYQYTSYARLLADSVFTLSPAGDTYDTYRTFEAAAKGSIPVVEDLPAYRNCESPAAAYRALGAPFMYVKNWREFPSVLASTLSGGSKALDEWQNKVTTWYQNLQSHHKKELLSFRENATQVKSERWTCETTYASSEANQALMKSASICAKKHYPACKDTNKYGGCCEEAAVQTCNVEPTIKSFTCHKSLVPKAVIR